MNCLHLLLSLFLSLSLFSCTTEDDYDFSEEPETEANDKRQEGNVTYNILVIGNSLSRDAFGYVPAILEENCPNIDVNMSILYIGGVALSSHWFNINNEYYMFTNDEYVGIEKKWTLTKDTGKNVIESREWDLVVLQEGSVSGRTYSITINNVYNISNYLKSIFPNNKVAYMINPSHGDGDSSLGSYSSDEVWEMFATTAYELCENNDVDYIIPCGTAIQNARHTYLDSLGSWGHLTYDGTHLQEGLPCLIDAYAATQALFDILEIDASIKDSNLQITQQWVKDKNIPGQHGKVIGGTAEDYELCKKCALEAINNPYSITEIE